MTDDLVRRLTIKAAVIEMGEKIQFGSDTALMREAADRIEELEAKLAKAVEALVITDKWLRELAMYANPDYHLAPSLQQVRTTLAELKGEK